MIATILGLTAFDLLATAYGLQIGAITEGNPIMAVLYDTSPLLAIGAGLALTSACVYILWRAKTPLAYYGLWAVLLIKVGIFGLHIAWLGGA